MDEATPLSVSEFVALFNQTMEFAYSKVVVVGELANFRISKNKWVYFDLKDEFSSLKFFATVYMLPGPLEDGMMLKARGQPRLHNLYGFSVNATSLQPVGEGSIRKAADLLRVKLEKEGLFDADRKRELPYPPQSIGLITSDQSAAYADFIKVLNARWRGIDIQLLNVQVQGEVSPTQIAAAIERFNYSAEPPDVLAVIRGGGSAEDLAAFSTELVARAIAASRIPTMVAVGHEINLSLAELAADSRASTPSNAAELLVPDGKQALTELVVLSGQIDQVTLGRFELIKLELQRANQDMGIALNRALDLIGLYLSSRASLLEAYDPKVVLRRGYAIVRDERGRVLRSNAELKPNDIVEVTLSKGGFKANVRSNNG